MTSEGHTSARPSLMERHFRAKLTRMYAKSAAQQQRAPRSMQKAAEKRARKAAMRANTNAHISVGVCPVLCGPSRDFATGRDGASPARHDAEANVSPAESIPKTGAAVNAGGSC